MKIWQDEKGAVIPLVAVLLVVIFLCAALVVDLGHLHNVKVQLQRAADAAALAGAGQLDGEEDQAARADAFARAAAAANRADGQSASADENVLTVTLGAWDVENLGAPAEARFSAGEETPNAVQVFLSREVGHIFFLFGGSSVVKADAIAVNIFEQQTFPFVLVSCIQTDETYIKPGENVCDIAHFKWGPDTTDTGGWTSLTYRPANNPNIEQFFSQDGLQLFNKIIYGTGEPHDGLENEEVTAGPTPFDETAFDSGASLCGESNVERRIVCGLGMDFDPANPPSPLPDPLDYGLSGGLPRWHDDDENQAAFDPDVDHFTRTWSMDGILMKGPGESDSAFETRMETLKTASDSGDYTPYESTYGPLDPDFKDGRFSRFIETQGNKTFPLYHEVLRYSGYPLVEVTNGVINAALQQFLEDVADSATQTFLASVSEEHAPFDADGSVLSQARGETLLLTLPVVFTGSCDHWKSLGGQPYVGLADILITRIWRGSNDGYDVGEDNPVTVIGLPADCSFPDFNPPNPGTTSDGRFLVVKGKGAALEGLVQRPSRGEKKESGIRKIYLVE